MITINFDIFLRWITIILVYRNVRWTGAGECNVPVIKVTQEIETARIVTTGTSATKTTVAVPRNAPTRKGRLHAVAQHLAQLCCLTSTLVGPHLSLKWIRVPWITVAAPRCVGVCNVSVSSYILFKPRITWYVLLVTLLFVIDQLLCSIDQPPLVINDRTCIYGKRWLGTRETVVSPSSLLRISAPQLLEGQQEILKYILYI